MAIVLEPFGKIDDRRRHQHDPRLLRDLAVQLIQLFSQFVAISAYRGATIEYSARANRREHKANRHGIDLGRLHIPPECRALPVPSRFAEFLVYLLIRNSWTRSIAIPSARSSGSEVATAENLRVEPDGRNALRSCLRSSSLRHSRVRFLSVPFELVDRVDLLL